MTTARALIGSLHSRVLLADAKTAMKFAFLLVVLALFGIAADAASSPRDPSAGRRAGRRPRPRGCLFRGFLAEAAALGAGTSPIATPRRVRARSRRRKSPSRHPRRVLLAQVRPQLPCPENTHFGSTAVGQCVLETPGTPQPSQCALICHPSVGGCPKGASCQPIQGLGVCTYASGPETFEKDAKDAETHD